MCSVWAFIGQLIAILVGIAMIAYFGVKIVELVQFMYYFKRIKDWYVESAPQGYGGLVHVDGTNLREIRARLDNLENLLKREKPNASKK